MVEELVCLHKYVYRYVCVCDAYVCVCGQFYFVYILLVFPIKLAYSCCDQFLHSVWFDYVWFDYQN